jgi:cytochrome c-type biogenesis protein CcmH/NrfG
VLLLTGQSRFMLGDYQKASEALEKAVQLEPRNAWHLLWLGRAYGRRAENASFLTAPGWARKARKSFEQAVVLDPRNLEAASDLLEYYLEAPGILGGGVDKAERLAAGIAGVDPAEHQYLLAKIAEKKQDPAAAERHLRRAAELAPKQVGRLIDLARFLSRHRRFEESDAVFQRAAQLAPGSPKLMYARASAYIGAGRNLGQARDLLGRYLTEPLTPDDPPRRDAERLLREARKG